MNQLKTATFDIGYTLLFPQKSLGSYFSQLLRPLGLKLDGESLDEQFMHAWFSFCKDYDGLIYGKDYDSVIVSWNHLIIRTLNELAPNQQLTEQQINHLAIELYTYFTQKEFWSLNPDWKETLKLCRSNDLKVGLISNWDISLRNILAEFNLTQDFDFMVISAEHAIEKPDPKIFQIAADLANCQLHEIMHIGDTWQDDIVAANQMGMQTCWFNSRQSNVKPPKQQLIIQNLTELAKIL